MPESLLISIVATPGDHTDHVGFNPYRKYVAKRADYVFVAAAALVCLGLVAWAFLG